MAAVSTRELRRVYPARDRRPAVTALDSVTLDIEEGEVHGLLGPNGAGKTTLVKVLSTVLLPTSGSASVLGHDVVTETATVRKLIGIVFGGERGLYPWISGRHNLAYWAALYHVPANVATKRVADLLERFGLAERADDPVETYSRGMRQRLHLARGLVAGARVLFLDEPTTGMDPLAAREFRTLVQDLRSEGRTLLLTTHDMVEAETVCDRVALIDHGRLLAVETPRTLATLVARHERVDFEATPDVVHRVRALPGILDISVLAGGSYRVEVQERSVIARVVALLGEAGVTSVRTSLPSLEEVYVHIIGDRGLQL
jgi:ABC-2 type transport system ATP-binding protein